MVSQSSRGDTYGLMYALHFADPRGNLSPLVGRQRIRQRCGFDAPASGEAINGLFTGL
jgi:hypothetical protein